MRRALTASFGLFVVVVSMTGCMERGSTAPVVSIQQECERSGGVWRGSSCQRESGGGY